MNKKIFKIIILLTLTLPVFLYGAALAGARECPPDEICNPIASDDLISLVKAVGAWVYKLAFPVAVVMIIYAGALLMLSQGNTKLIERGRKMLLYAVIGLAVILIGRGFFTLIRSILDLGNP